MKKILFILFVVLASKTGNTQCTINYVQLNNFVWGCSTADSLFFDAGPEYILNFKVDGEVRNFNDDVEATYNRSTGEFFDLNDDLMIVIEPDLEVKDFLGHKVGSIEEVSGVKYIYDGNHDLLAYYVGTVDPYFVVYFFRYYLLIM